MMAGAASFPEVLVRQQLQSPANVQPVEQRVVVVGPHGDPHRFDEDDEKDSAEVGAYDPDADTTLDYPDREADSVIDLDSVKVYIEDALCEYYTDAIGSGETVAANDTINEITRTGNFGFKANGEDYPRITALGDRDVAVGDWVRVTGDVGGDDVTHLAQVRSFKATTVAATIGTATAASSNGPTQSQVVGSVSQVAGVTSTLTLTIDATDYNSWVDGTLDDTYYLEVTRTCLVEGDLTTARVKLTTASGLDNQSNITPGAEGDDFEVGARGLLANFSFSGSGDTPDLIAGQKWSFTIQDDYIEVVGTSGGTYTGTQDTTYIVTVTRGGTITAVDEDDRPQITATTSHGIDQSLAPIRLDADDTFYLLTSKGVTFKVASGTDGVRKGDSWTIAVTAEGDGYFSTIVLSKALPADLQGEADLDLVLYVKRTVEIERLEAGGLENWTRDQDNVVLNGGLVATISGFDDPLAITEGTVFIEYVAWLDDLCGTRESVSITDIDDLISGPIDEKNPLKYGVYKALLNSGVSRVDAVAVCDPTSLESWTDALDVIRRKTGIYHLVPLTEDEDVLQAYAAYSLADSAPESFCRRQMWCSLPARSEKSLVDDDLSEDEEVVMATFAEDPDEAGTQYTLVQLSSDNADFVELGVAEGDVVRTEYGYDGFDTSYRSYTIAEVVSSDVLILETGPSNAIDSPGAKIEIWHPMTKVEQIEDLQTRLSAIAGDDTGPNSGIGQACRVVNVWPDLVGDSGTTVKGYFLAAAVSGSKSGIEPHRAVTRRAISGFTGFERNDYLGEENLRKLAYDGACGVLVVERTDAGTIRAKNGLTAAHPTRNEARRSEMFICNFDNVALIYKTALDDWIGRTNVTEETRDVLLGEVNSIGQYLSSAATFVPELGYQMAEGRVKTLEINPFQLDTWDLEVHGRLPLETNSIDMTLVAVVGPGTDPEEIQPASLTN
jgi:hypothetical protein